MTALTDLTEEEAFLWAILTDDTGIDLAEFDFPDPGHESNVYRVRDYQWPLYDCRDMFQATQGGRNLGKSMGIQARAAVFPFCYPGSDMLLTAPELNHLKPLVDAVEERITQSWLVRQMLPQGAKSNGFTRQPHWECHFVNGSKLISRLPGAAGNGTKGQHCRKIELDEAQDYIEKGWENVREVLNQAEPGAQWRVHGVPTGVRTTFYDITQGADSLFTVHRPMAMMRDTWTPEERADKVNFYGGSRQSQGYRTNIYGEHGDTANALFVLARLVRQMDLNAGSVFNTDVYERIEIDFDHLQGETDEDRVPAASVLRFNGAHKSGWADAPAGYSSYHAGMDVGGTNDPSEILVFGQRAGVQVEKLDLLMRITMRRIPLFEQEEVVHRLFEHFGSKLVTFGVDKTGMGFDLAQRLEARYPGRAFGYNFSEKLTVGFEDRELEDGESMEDLEIRRNVVDQASDWLREIVDTISSGGGFLLPNDSELVRDWQGQTYTTGPRTKTDPYGKRSYQGGKSHTLDAAKMMIAAKRLAPVKEILDAPARQDVVLERFFGA